MFSYSCRLFPGSASGRFFLFLARFPQYLYWKINHFVQSVVFFCPQQSSRNGQIYHRDSGKKDEIFRFSSWWLVKKSSDSYAESLGIHVRIAVVNHRKVFVQNKGGGDINFGRKERAKRKAHCV
jgi:hypothetical protein